MPCSGFFQSCIKWIPIKKNDKKYRSPHFQKKLPQQILEKTLDWFETGLNSFKPLSYKSGNF